jgi:hypothetical protein
MTVLNCSAATFEDIVIEIVNYAKLFSVIPQFDDMFIKRSYASV